MRNKYLVPIFAGVGYCGLLVFFVVNSGAGHGWGTGALVTSSMPLGLLAIGADAIFPNYGLGWLFPILGLVQWLGIGYMIGKRMDRNNT